MLHNYSRRFFSTFSSLKNTYSSAKAYQSPVFKFAKTALMLSVPTYVAYSYFSKKEQSRLKASPVFQQSLSFNIPQSKINTTLIEPKTLFQKIYSFFSHTLRFFQLLWIFMPTVILLPLRLFKRTEDLWMKIFVNSVQRAGVVMIKAFQYLSHRRDVIGSEMADNFAHLRQFAPMHSFEDTRNIFKCVYGKDIYEVFEDFDPIPIASGSVSQVYRAKMHDKKVAVKVRHPSVDRYIQQDVNILFFISKVFSLFSKSYDIPIGEDSFKRTLVEQIDFNIQRKNLEVFNEMFAGNRWISFPIPFKEETRDAVLVETFVEGVPITFFETHKHPLNGVIARLGAAAFFQMLMKNNFIHADCHGGNFIVELTDKSSTFLSEVSGMLKIKQ